MGRNLAFLLILAGCTSPPPAGNLSPGESLPQPVRFQRIDTIVPLWQPLGPGMLLMEGRLSEPRLEFWAFRLDLAEPRLTLTVGPVPPEGDPAAVPSVKVSSFVRSLLEKAPPGTLALGINATPFDRVTSREGEPLIPAGLVISGGREIAPPVFRYDALVMYGPSPAAAVQETAAVPEAADQVPRAAAITGQGNLPGGPIAEAAGGFYRVLTAGEPASQALSRRGAVRHPRSAAGLSGDGTVLYLLVIDGRRRDSAGATEEETALILRQLGAMEGLCFDGGGSTTLALGSAGVGKPAVRVLNRPVHGGIPGRERAVAVCLGILVR